MPTFWVRRLLPLSYNFKAMDTENNYTSKIWQILSSAEYSYIWNIWDVEDFSDNIDWNEISSQVNQHTSIDYVRKYKAYLNFTNFSHMFYAFLNVRNEFIPFVIEFKNEIKRDKTQIEQYIYSYKLYRDVLKYFPEIKPNYRFLTFNVDDVENYKNDIDWIEISKNLYNLVYLNRKSELYFDIIAYEFFNEYSQYVHWNIISQNTRIIWDWDFINTWKNHLNWSILIHNPAINWSYYYAISFEQYLLPLIVDEQFKESFLWKLLMTKEALKNFKVSEYRITPNALQNNQYSFIKVHTYTTFTELYYSHVQYDSFKALSSIQGSFWNINFLREYKKLLDWNLISINPSIVWNKACLQEFSDVISISKVLETIALCGNAISIDSILEEYACIFNWELYFSKNKTITTESINKFCAKISNEQFTANTNFAWDCSFIRTHKKNICWNTLSKNIKVINKDELLIAFYNDWNWDIVLSNRKTPILDIQLYDKILLKTTLTKYELLDTCVKYILVNEYMSTHSKLKNITKINNCI